MTDRGAEVTADRAPAPVPELRPEGLVQAEALAEDAHLGRVHRRIGVEAHQRIAGGDPHDEEDEEQTGDEGGQGLK